MKKHENYDFYPKDQLDEIVKTLKLILEEPNVTGETRALVTKQLDKIQGNKCEDQIINVRNKLIIILLVFISVLCG